MYLGARLLNYPTRPAAQYPYEVIEDTTTLPVTLDEVKAQIKLDLTITAADDYLTLLIKAATKIAEEYTRRSFINKTYRTYRNNFSSGYFVLRRSKLQEIAAFTYKKDNTEIAVPADSYYFSQSSDYSSIQLLEGKSWPTAVDNRFDAITIDFIAGYGEEASAVPADLRLALLNHIAALYFNRGDCDCDNKAGASSIPANALIVYEDYKIKDISGDLYY